MSNSEVQYISGTLEDIVEEFAQPIPVYYIDLSKPPEHRYDHVVKDFTSSLDDLRVLYDQILDEIPIPNSLMHLISRLLLRRVYDNEEMRELKGISRAAGISLYLLVAFNVILDLLMACTSGGTRVLCQCKKCSVCSCSLCTTPETLSIRSSRSENLDSDSHSKRTPSMLSRHSTSKSSQRTSKSGPCGEMVHFRMLDWDMDALRKVVVELRYIKHENGPTIATNITYLGFVGVLTAVRQDLSVSLNFRPYRARDYSLMSNIKYYLNFLAVLLGFRESISSKMRKWIIPETNKDGSIKDEAFLPSYDTLIRTAPSIRSPSCYLILCNGYKTCVIEKDPTSGSKKQSSEYIAVTNSDITSKNKPMSWKLGINILQKVDLKGIIRNSDQRRASLKEHYNERKKRYRRVSVASCGRGTSSTAIRLHDLIYLMMSGPVLNDMTHYSVIMDPSHNKVSWALKFEEPFCWDDVAKHFDPEGTDVDEEEEIRADESRSFHNSMERVNETNENTSKGLDSDVEERDVDFTADSGMTSGVDLRRSARLRNGSNKDSTT